MLNGSDDPVIPAGTNSELHNLITDAQTTSELIEFPKVGHSVTDEMIFTAKTFLDRVNVLTENSA